MSTSDAAERPRLHATVEDARRFIKWFEADGEGLTNWDRERYESALRMVAEEDAANKDENG